MSFVIRSYALCREHNIKLCMRRAILNLEGSKLNTFV